MRRLGQNEARMAPVGLQRTPLGQGDSPCVVHCLILKFVVTFISTSIGTQFSSVVLNCH